MSLQGDEWDGGNSELDDHDGEGLASSASSEQQQQEHQSQQPAARGKRKGMYTEEERRNRRRLANRESARRMRAKRSEAVQQLESSVSRLKDKNKQLEKQNKEYAKALQKLQADMESMKGQMQASSATQQQQQSTSELQQPTMSCATAMQAQQQQPMLVQGMHAGMPSQAGAVCFRGQLSLAGAWNSWQPGMPADSSVGQQQHLPPPLLPLSTQDLQEAILQQQQQQLWQLQQQQQQLALVRASPHAGGTAAFTEPERQQQHLRQAGDSAVQEQQQLQQPTAAMQALHDQLQQHMQLPMPLGGLGGETAFPAPLSVAARQQHDFIQHRQSAKQLQQQGLAAAASASTASHSLSRVLPPTPRLGAAPLQRPPSPFSGSDGHPSQPLPSVELMLSSSRASKAQTTAAAAAAAAAALSCDGSGSGGAGSFVRPTSPCHQQQDRQLTPAADTMAYAAAAGCTSGGSNIHASATVPVYCSAVHQMPSASAGVSQQALADAAAAVSSQVAPASSAFAHMNRLAQHGHLAFAAQGAAVAAGSTAGPAVLPFGPPGFGEWLGQSSVSALPGTTQPGDLAGKEQQPSSVGVQQQWGRQQQDLAITGLLKREAVASVTVAMDSGQGLSTGARLGALSPKLPLHAVSAPPAAGFPPAADALLEDLMKADSIEDKAAGQEAAAAATRIARAGLDDAGLHPEQQQQYKLEQQQQTQLKRAGGFRPWSPRQNAGLARHCQAASAAAAGTAAGASAAGLLQSAGVQLGSTQQHSGMQLEEEREQLQQGGLSGDLDLAASDGTAQAAETDAVVAAAAAKLAARGKAFAFGFGEQHRQQHQQPLATYVAISQPAAPNAVTTPAAADGGGGGRVRGVPDNAGPSNPPRGVPVAVRAAALLAGPSLDPFEKWAQRHGAAAAAVGKEGAKGILQQLGSAFDLQVPGIDVPPAPVGLYGALPVSAVTASGPAGSAGRSIRRTSIDGHSRQHPGSSSGRDHHPPYHPREGPLHHVQGTHEHSGHRAGKPRFPLKRPSKLTASRSAAMTAAETGCTVSTLFQGSCCSEWQATGSSTQHHLKEQQQRRRHRRLAAAAAAADTDAVGMQLVSCISRAGTCLTGDDEVDGAFAAAVVADGDVDMLSPSPRQVSVSMGHAPSMVPSSAAAPGVGESAFSPVHQHQQLEASWELQQHQQHVQWQGWRQGGPQQQQVSQEQCLLQPALSLPCTDLGPVRSGVSGAADGCRSFASEPEARAAGAATGDWDGGWEGCSGLLVEAADGRGMHMLQQQQWQQQPIHDQAMFSARVQPQAAAHSGAESQAAAVRAAGIRAAADGADAGGTNIPTLSPQLQELQLELQHCLQRNKIAKYLQRQQQQELEMATDEPGWHAVPVLPAVPEHAAAAAVVPTVNANVSRAHMPVSVLPASAAVTAGTPNGSAAGSFGCAATSPTPAGAAAAAAVELRGSAEHAVSASYAPAACEATAAGPLPVVRSIAGTGSLATVSASMAVLSAGFGGQEPGGTDELQDAELSDVPTSPPQLEALLASLQQQEQQQGHQGQLLLAPMVSAAAGSTQAPAAHGVSAAGAAAAAAVGSAMRDELQHELAEASNGMQALWLDADAAGMIRPLSASLQSLHPGWSASPSLLPAVGLGGGMALPNRPGSNGQVAAAAIAAGHPAAAADQAMRFGGMLQQQAARQGLLPGSPLLLPQQQGAAAASEQAAQLLGPSSGASPDAAAAQPGSLSYMAAAAAAAGMPPWSTWYEEQQQWLDDVLDPDLLPMLRE